MKTKKGTRGCLYPLRANSRPMCVCNLDYAGSYCQSYSRVYNFSVELDQKLRLEENSSLEIET